MDTFNPSQMPPVAVVPPKKSLGPLIAVITILLLIVVGGLYFLKQRSAQEVYVPTVEQTDAITASLKQQGASDDLGAIEADLKATNLDNLDDGAAALEAQM